VKNRAKNKPLGGLIWSHYFLEIGNVRVVVQSR